MLYAQCDLNSNACMGIPETKLVELYLFSQQIHLKKNICELALLVLKIF